MRELETVGAESIGFDDLRAGFDIGLVDAEDGFRLCGVEFIEAALRADGFVQHGAHGAIGDEDRVFDAFVEVENFHWKKLSITCTSSLAEGHLSWSHPGDSKCGQVENTGPQRSVDRVQPQFLPAN